MSIWINLRMLIRPYFFQISFRIASPFSTRFLMVKLFRFPFSSILIISLRSLSLSHPFQISFRIVLWVFSCLIFPIPTPYRRPGRLLPFTGFLCNRVSYVPPFSPLLRSWYLFLNNPLLGSFYPAWLIASAHRLSDFLGSFWLAVCSRNFFSCLYHPTALFDRGSDFFDAFCPFVNFSPSNV